MQVDVYFLYTCMPINLLENFVYILYTKCCILFTSWMTSVIDEVKEWGEFTRSLGCKLLIGWLMYALTYKFTRKQDAIEAHLIPTLPSYKFLRPLVIYRPISWVRNAPVNVNPRSPQPGQCGDFSGDKVNVWQSTVPRYTGFWMRFASSVAGPGNIFCRRSGVSRKRLGPT